MSYVVLTKDTYYILREQQLRELMIDLREPRFSEGKVDILSSSEESLLSTLNEQQRQSIENVSSIFKVNCIVHVSF